jgi:hypothetical protein
MNPNTQPTSWPTRGIFFLVCLAMILWSQITLSQSMRSKDEIGRIVAVEKVMVKDGTVSGEVHNLSPNTLRDVQLYILDIWLWDNEFHPGNNDPSTSFIYTVPNEIPPGGHLPFTYSPSQPLPKPSGGHFITSVSVAGFTEVILPMK